MREVDEVRREPRIAVAGGAVQAPTDAREAVRHRPLLVRARLEAREGGDGNRGGLVVGRAGEGRVHDHQIDRFVRQREVLYVLVALRAARLPLPGGEQGAGLRREDQVEGADGDTALPLLSGADPVGHRVDAGVVEDLGWMDARQLRGAQMRGRRHDVGRHDGALDHLAMDALVVAAGMAVSGEDGVVGGGEKRSRAAGKVGHGVVRIGGEIAPVGVQAGHGQFREQGGAGRQGVEGRQKLPVGDQVLEHPARQVVARRRPDMGEPRRDVGENGEERPRRRGADVDEEVGGYLEDRPVVDLVEDAPPRTEKPCLEGGFRLGLELLDRRDSVHAGDRDVEGQRIGDDGHRHAGGLFAGALIEDLPEIVLDVREAPRGGVLDDAGGDAHAVFEDRHAPVHQALRHHRVFEAEGNAVDASREPARLGPAPGQSRVAREHAVIELGGGDAFREIGLAPAEGGRDANGDGLFDRLAHSQRPLAEPGHGVALDAGGRGVLRLHRHRLRVRHQDENIGPQAGGFGKDVGLFDAHTTPPQGMHVAQNLREMAVEDGFPGARHQRPPSRTPGPATAPSTPRCRTVIANLIAILAGGAASRNSRSSRSRSSRRASVRHFPRAIRRRWSSHSVSARKISMRATSTRMK